ncbi:MAG: phosphatidate cytidylyltransferase [Blastocatellia bacterium]|jgi:phosphatidate cytidylyltransferase|nr:phosphatidate cytidylyltransferase [Blastocatellia bacterium]
MSRIITALIALPVIVASILISWLAPLFVLLALAAMVLGLYEFWLLARRREIKPDVVAGYVGAAAIFTVFYFNEPGQPPDLLLLVLPGFIIGVLAAAMLRGAPFEKMMASAGATVLGVSYVALLGGHLVAVRTGFPQTLSAHLLSFFFLVIMGSDTGAYYAGRTFGKHKLAPGISPGKTWEGAIGGMLVSLLMSVLAHYWFFPELPLKWGLPLAALMNVLGVLGDLTESALKRGAGAKDAAQILPGHGGLLDRLDSLLFNAPVIYYFGKLYFQ